MNTKPQLRSCVLALRIRVYNGPKL